MISTTQNQSISNAISSSGTMLSIQDYITTTNFNIDTLVFNRFWSTMHDDMPMYIDDTLVRWCGYEGESKNTRMALMRLLKRHDIPYIQLSADEYQSFRTIGQGSISSCQMAARNLYPEINTAHGKNRTKHLLLQPDNFKRVMMMVNTKRGDEVRNYYLSLERLFKEYSNYQLKFQEHRLEVMGDRLINIEQIQKQTLKKLDEESKRTEAAQEEILSKMDEITLLREEVHELNENLDDNLDKLEVVCNQRALPRGDPGAEECFRLLYLRPGQYYVLRGKNAYVTRKLRAKSSMYSDLRVVLAIGNVPNALTLNHQIKEELSNKIRMSGSNIKTLVTLSDEELATDIQRLYNMRVII